MQHEVSLKWNKAETSEAEETERGDGDSQTKTGVCPLQARQLRCGYYHRQSG